MILHERWFLLAGSLAGGLAVLGGAFGTHVLRPRLSERAFEIFELAVQYQMYHGLALLGCGLLLAMFARRAVGAETGRPHRLIAIAGVLFIVGIVLFSGSLYVYSLADVRLAVRVTPFGGFAWLAGWICLAIGSLRIGGASREMNA